METPQPYAAGTEFDPALRMHYLRTVAQLLSTDAPVAGLWPRLAAPIAALLDAERVMVVVRGAAGERVVFDSRDAGPPADDAVPAGGIAAGVLASGETVARSETDAVALGVPIRFGSTLLGAIVLGGVRADLTLIPLLESCALYVGARIHSESAIEATQRNAELALVDALTGIANRRKFDETLETEWARARREGAPIALVMIDIDYFKAFNDSYGHQAGDLCLQQVARALAECAQRPTDLFARYGGEEFVALLPSTDVDGATAFGERLRAALGRLNIAHSGSSLGHVSLSAGVAAARPRDAAPPAELIAAADAALYDAKIAGRNRVVTRNYVSDSEPAERVSALARTNLPLTLSSLVGRHAEIAELRALLAEQRLVSVVGAGGTGKTRLTLHVAAEYTAAMRDGVWLVELAAVNDPARVAGAFAGALGAGVPTGPPGIEALVRLFAAKHALLVVDNCEHVLAETARVIAALARTCPGLHIVATSREPLGITGEIRYRLPLLSLPPPDPNLRAADALASDAVALFVERARAVRRTFALDDTNAATVATIVRRLDGIALAIELAAARLEATGLETLGTRLDQRFRVLTGGDRGALPRQRTLRATFDWSFDLLTEAERTLFRRLAIFAGPFTIDAATATCAGEAVSTAEVFDLLIALVRKSLAVDDTGGTDGFVLLESLRAYGREKLAEAGESEVLARRHAAYYADLADQAGHAYAGTPTREWLASAERHLTNYRAALAWSLDARRDVVLGARLAASLALSLGDNAAEEGVRWLQTALDALPAGMHPSIEAQVWLRLAGSVRALPANALREAAERAVAFYRTLDERANLAHALRALAQTLCWYFRREREAADTFAQEAIAVARSSGDPLTLAYALRTRALAMDAGAVDEKREHLEESLTLFRRYGNEQQIGSALTWMSEMEFSAGEEVRALGYGRAALRYAEASGSRSRLEVSAANLAIYAASAGDWATAVRTGTRALRVAAEARSAAGITWSVQALASVAAGLDEPRRAARLLGFCDARCGTLHAPRQAEQCEDISARRLRVRLAAVLDPATIGGELETGAQLAEDEAIAEALAVEQLAADIH
jgi:diguanylate cyclase (GGDEF)-like protein